jgi:UDP-glucose 4-epimerase
MQKKQEPFLDAFDKTPVLVTGGYGFIGSHLVEWLVNAGASVTVLDNFQAGKVSNLETIAGRVERVDGDVRNAADVDAVIGRIEPRYIFHLAANASVPLSVDEPAYDFQTNSSGTFVVLDAVRRLARDRCKKVVVASSGAVYGEPASFPIRETDALAPISPYGASKLGAEIEARIYERVYQVPAVLARIFNAYGPRMARFVILDFLRKLHHDPSRLEVLGTGQQIRDFTYVTDTVQGLLHLAIYGVPCEAYNLSSGAYNSVNALALEMIDVIGLTGKTEIRHTGSSWVGDAQRWEVAIDKIRDLGYAPKISLRQGIENTLEWFRAENIR